MCFWGPLKQDQQHHTTLWHSKPKSTGKRGRGRSEMLRTVPCVHSPCSVHWKTTASVAVCWWVIFRLPSTTRSINSLQNRLEPVSRVPGSIKTNGSINPQEQEQHLFCLHWFGPVRLTAARTLRGFSGLRIHQPIAHNATSLFHSFLSL